MANEARAILDDLFSKSDNAIIRDDGGETWCVCCRAILADHFDDAAEWVHKPDCPCARYRKMVEGETK